MDLTQRQIESDRFPIVYRNDAVVYENRAALPRAFVVGEWETAAGPAEARSARSPAPSTFATTRSSRVPPGRRRRARPRGGGDLWRPPSDDRPRPVAGGRRPDRHVLPGLAATVDGQPAPSIGRRRRRGVFVGAGRHRVVMRFRPPSQTAGFLIGAVAVLGIAVLATHQWPDAFLIRSRDWAAHSRATPSRSALFPRAKSHVTARRRRSSCAGREEAQRRI